MIDPKGLFGSPSVALRWFEMPEGQMFLEYVNSALEYSRARLEKETEMVEIYRRQGRVDALKDIANLPKELRQTLKGKAA